VKIKRPAQKPCIFIGSSLKDLRRFPAKVKNRVGFALNAVQEGGEPVAAKALRGFGGRTVLELVEDFDSDTCTCFMPSRRRGRKASPRHSRTSN
jgi:phage-related protein